MNKPESSHNECNEFINSLRPKKRRSSDTLQSEAYELINTASQIQCQAVENLIDCKVEPAIDDYDCAASEKSFNLNGNCSISICQELAEWSAVFDISNSALDALLKILQRILPDIPTDSETLKAYLREDMPSDETAKVEVIDSTGEKTPNKLHYSNNGCPTDLLQLIFNQTSEINTNVQSLIIENREIKQRITNLETANHKIQNRLLTELTSQRKLMQGDKVPSLLPTRPFDNVLELDKFEQNLKESTELCEKLVMPEIQQRSIHIKNTPNSKIRNSTDNILDCTLLESPGANASTSVLVERDSTGRIKHKGICHICTKRRPTRKACTSCNKPVCAQHSQDVCYCCCCLF